MRYPGWQTHLRMVADTKGLCEYQKDQLFRPSGLGWALSVTRRCALWHLRRTIDSRLTCYAILFLHAIYIQGALHVLIFIVLCCNEMKDVLFRGILTRF